MRTPTTNGGSVPPRNGFSNLDRAVRVGRPEPQGPIGNRDFDTVHSGVQACISNSAADILLAILCSIFGADAYAVIFRVPTSFDAWSTLRVLMLEPLSFVTTQVTNA